MMTALREILAQLGFNGAGDPNLTGARKFLLAG